MKLNRRNFGQALGLAALLPSLDTATFGREATTAPKKLRFCIVGLGRISLQHFMPGCRISQKSQITAFVSGHRPKAEEQGRAYGIDPKNLYDYSDFDRIADNPDIDAVYIALPNSMHAEYTIRAAKAGKHVLCEKPMATSVKDSESMISACKAAGRKLMIAYRCQYEPMNLRAIELVRSGALGSVQAIESANGFVEKAGEWRLDRKLAGGGPLMDVGVYSLNACRYLTGEEPVKFEGYSSSIDKDGRFDQVEETLSWTMRFPSGIVASCNTTYGAPMEGFFRVHGSKGTLHMEPAFSYEGIRLRTNVKSQDAIDELSPVKDPGQFATQADYFAQCVFADKEPRSNGQEGLRDMKHMEAIYHSAGLKLG